MENHLYRSVQKLIIYYYAIDHQQVVNPRTRKRRARDTPAHQHAISKGLELHSSTKHKVLL